MGNSNISGTLAQFHRSMQASSRAPVNHSCGAQNRGSPLLRREPSPSAVRRNQSRSQGNVSNERRVVGPPQMRRTVISSGARREPVTSISSEYETTRFIVPNERAISSRVTSKRNLPALSADISALPVQLVTLESCVGDQMRCVVCLDDFRPGDSLKTMPCMHIFHKGCVDRWLWTDNSCPICKTPIGQATLPGQRASADIAEDVLRHQRQELNWNLVDEIPDEPRIWQTQCRCGRRPCRCNERQAVGSVQHKCVCSQGMPAECKSAAHHRCVCDIGLSHVCRAQHLEHHCICRSGHPMQCKADEHPCLCGAGVTTRCRAGRLAHECICARGTPSMCRGAHHQCICGTGTTVHCRAERSAHDCVCGSGMSCRCRVHRQIISV